MNRWWRRLVARPGPRYCSACSQPLEYSVYADRDERTGKPKRWTWAAACPESSVLFKSGGGWSGNGHAFSHSLHTTVGPPTWIAPMRRAMAMRSVLRPRIVLGYAERVQGGLR